MVVGFSARKPNVPILIRQPLDESLTGHLVISSGQMWAPLEAGSSQVLKAVVGWGKRKNWDTPTLHTHPPASQKAARIAGWL